MSLSVQAGAICLFAFRRHAFPARGELPGSKRSYVILDARCPATMLAPNRRIMRAAAPMMGFAALNPFYGPVGGRVWAITRNAAGWLG
jgi:hypothetical protein